MSKKIKEKSEEQLKSKSELTPEEKLMNPYRIDGVLAEANESLKRRFTNAELLALKNIMWFSDEMTAMRQHIGQIQGELMDMKSKMPKNSGKGQ